MKKKKESNKTEILEETAVFLSSLREKGVRTISTDKSGLFYIALTVGPNVASGTIDPKKKTWKFHPSRSSDPAKRQLRQLLQGFEKDGWKPSDDVLG
jgi:hypothetical protein